MGPNSLAADVAIGAFEIEDLLVGPVCMENSYLARSSLPVRESFHDPSLDITTMHQTPSEDSAASDEQFQDASDELPQANSQGQALVLQYAKWTPKSPEYQDVDAQVHVKLKTLSFFGNRPTLGALMAIGKDISTASAAKPPDAPAAAMHRQVAEGESPEERATADCDEGAEFSQSTMPHTQSASVFYTNMLQGTVCVLHSNMDTVTHNLLEGSVMSLPFLFLSSYLPIITSKKSCLSHREPAGSIWQG